MNGSGTENEKFFSDFSHKEREILIEKNYDFLNNELIDWNKIKKEIKKNLKFKEKKLGLNNLKMKISKDNKIKLAPCAFERINKTIETLMNYEDCEENNKILQIALNNSLLIKDITENYMDVKIEIENEKLLIVLSCSDFTALIEVIKKDFNYFLKRVKINSVNKEILNTIKNIELQRIYNEDIGAKIILDVLMDFIKEKITEMIPFENYLNLKIEEVRKEMEMPLNNIVPLEKLLMKRTDILFDEQGHARKFRE